MATGSTETEIKLPVADLDAIQQKIRALKLRRKTPRTFEANVLLDTAQADLRGRGCLLRLRQYGKRFVVTYKGPGSAGKHKVREEIEAELASLVAIEAIFERLGYRPTFRYEKYRTEYSDGHGLLTLDETPIGTFLELEGEADWIDEMAKQLGYTEADYVTSSYGRLYLDYCAARSITPTHMVFR